MKRKAEIEREFAALAQLASVMGYQTAFRYREETEGRNAGKTLREITIRTTQEDT